MRHRPCLVRACSILAPKSNHSSEAAREDERKRGSAAPSKKNEPTLRNLISDRVQLPFWRQKRERICISRVGHCLWTHSMWTRCGHVRLCCRLRFSGKRRVCRSRQREVVVKTLSRCVCCCVTKNNSRTSRHSRQTPLRDE